MFIVPFLLLDAQLHHGDDWQDHFSISIERIEASIDDVPYPGNRGPRLHAPEEIVLIEERRKSGAERSKVLKTGPGQKNRRKVTA
jgi:hypothetical protein